MVKAAAKQRASSDPPAQDAPEAPFDQAEGEPLVLDLSQLIADSRGEVVLFNDSGLRSLTISTPAAVVEEGEVEAHVTAAGEDVSGFRYIAFDNGVRLFHEPGLELILSRPDR